MSTRPRKGEEKGLLLDRLAFCIYKNEHWDVRIRNKKERVTGQQLVEILARLRQVDPTKSKGDIVKALIAEAGFYHSPGNPGLGLEHFLGEHPLPFSPAAEDKGFRNQNQRVLPCPQCKGTGESQPGITCSHCAGQKRITEE